MILILNVQLVLNEQYMISEHAPNEKENGATLTNRVLKVLSYHGPDYKSFGENVILLLNRESKFRLDDRLFCSYRYLRFSQAKHRCSS